MESTSFAIPVSPGKTDEARLIFSESMGKRRVELAESCNRNGITHEFAWIQKSTRGGDLLILHLEAEDIGLAMGRWAAADSPYDTWLKEQLFYVTGIDFTKAEDIPPLPDVLCSLQVDAVAHAIPVASASPVVEGKADQLRAWFEELKGPRVDELRNYLERGGLARETWYLQTSPGDDTLITFALVEDPDKSFRGFTRSEHRFDTWMKEKLLEFTGIDYNAPKTGPEPEIHRAELILDWHHDFQAVV
ncbi:hypothetical protein BMS3Abin01_00754 [bacterium BMS3Abin01]|nr:hypothetical protein BMS3Abin01_00754 [bacterium BMS3Abin01]HDZ59564.1 hypothetical protein [Actinomycetota bacterium]